MHAAGALLTTLGVACAAGLAGCATAPAGPSLPALQGSRMTPAQFVADDAHCSGVASAHAGGVSPSDAANQSAVTSAAAGTAIGAVTGALIDGSSGAAAGAGVGLLFGALAGTTTAQGTYAVVQRQFDGAYHACMYARGHKVPVPADSVERYRAVYGQVAPPARPVPPPPSRLAPPDGSAPPLPQTDR